MLILRRGSEGVRGPYALRKNRENLGRTDGRTFPIYGDRDVISASRNNYGAAGEKIKGFVPKSGKYDTFILLREALITSRSP